MGADFLRKTLGGREGEEEDGVPGWADKLTGTSVTVLGGHAGVICTSLLLLFICWSVVTASQMILHPHQGHSC